MRDTDRVVPAADIRLWVAEMLTNSRGRFDPDEAAAAAAFVLAGPAARLEARSTALRLALSDREVRDISINYVLARAKSILAFVETGG